MLVTPWNVDEFPKFRELVQSLRVQTGTEVTVKPFAAQWDFRVTALGSGVEVDNYFDIGNFSAGNISAAAFPNYKGRSVYFGSLYMTTFIDALVGSGTFDSLNYLVNGTIGQQTTWLYKARNQPALASIDLNINSPSNPNGFVDRFENVMFSFLRKRVNIQGVGNQAREATEWIFNGVRIDY